LTIFDPHAKHQPWLASGTASNAFKNFFWCEFLCHSFVNRGKEWELLLYTALFNNALHLGPELDCQETWSKLSKSMNLRKRRWPYMS
jgi:hypothetical protein